MKRVIQWIRRGYSFGLLALVLALTACKTSGDRDYGSPPHHDLFYCYHCGFYHPYHHHHYHYYHHGRGHSPSPGPRFIPPRPPRPPGPPGILPKPPRPGFPFDD